MIRHSYLRGRCCLETLMLIFEEAVDAASSLFCLGTGNLPIDQLRYVYLADHQSSNA